MTICTYFQPPFKTRLHVQFEEIWPRGLRGEVVQRCKRTDVRTDDGRRVITIAHPEPWNLLPLTSRYAREIKACQTGGYDIPAGGGKEAF